MFNGSIYLESKEAVENCGDASHLFQDCTSLKKIKSLSKWNMSSCSNISSMFEGCLNLLIFSDCSNLKSLEEFENWDTSSIMNHSFAFNKYYNLKSLKGL